MFGKLCVYVLCIYILFKIATLNRSVRVVIFAFVSLIFYVFVLIVLLESSVPCFLYYLVFFAFLDLAESSKKTNGKKGAAQFGHLRQKEVRFQQKQSHF